MKFVDAAEVHRLLDWPYAIEALRQAHLGGLPQTGRAVLEEPRADGQPNVLISVSAWQPGTALGVKLVASFPGNVAEHALPTVNALYVLFDPETGVPHAVLDGEALIFRKTATDSALGSALLSRPDARTLLMIGAGAIAPYLIGAHRTARPSLDTVLIWNRTVPRAEKLAEQLRQEGVRSHAIADLDEALGVADIVSAATMTETPLIKGALLKPGTHVDLVGAFRPTMREADDDTVRRARLFCDTTDCITRSGELRIPLHAGIITRDKIEGDLFDLCGGKIPGRQSGTDITLYKNGSGGHIDLFVASSLDRRLTGR